MQGASSIQRTSQRRQNGSADPNVYQYSAPPTPTQSTYNGSQGGQSARSSSGSGAGASGGGSGRSSSGRRRDPSQQLSQIEKSVTHLLIATKQLLETLTQWSRHQATEGEVSDVYVRLGYEFNIACRAFTSIGVDISDLGNVPDLLRAILEDTLSQDPSPASLDRYLPRIRDIIINLLQGLKRKQQKLRTRQGSQGQSGAPVQGKALSESILEPGYDMYGATGDNQGRSSAATYASESSNPYTSTYGQPDDKYASTRATSVNSADGQFTQAQAQTTGNSFSQQPDDPGNETLQPTTYDSRAAYNSSQEATTRHAGPSSTDKIPLPPPTPYSDVIPKDFPAPPPIPPAQPRAQDALAQLQRGGELERRASRRYSAYQIQKHLGQSPGSMPMIPPAQHGPIPNRGKEQRDSLNAVRSRSSLITRQKSSRFTDASPSGVTLSDNKYVAGDQENLLGAGQQSEKKREGSPLARQPSVREDAQSEPSSPVKASMRATLTGPLDLSATDYIASPSDKAPSPAERPTRLENDLKTPNAVDESVQDEPFVPDQSPEPGKPLTLFLQYKSKIKKYVLQDGYTELTVGRLQLAFIEKFAWHTYNNGVDLPEIYIQDPVSGVRHELEDLSDVKDRTVLVLNVEAVDEVKRHFDGALGGIQQAIDSMRNVVEKQQSSLQLVSSKQEEAAKEIARLASAPPVAAPTRAPATGKYQSNGVRNLSGEHMTEVQTLRRDLAIMRQTLTTFTSGMTTSVNAIREKAATVKAKAADAALPSSESESGRAYVNAGKKTVGEDSENLVNRVDDLQDVVEELRKDVTRGVRPLPDQIQTVTADFGMAADLLKKMKATIKKEKPVWTKIWEKELELVCTDREFLTLQEELAADLEDDLEKATQTFALVQEATKQQNHQQAAGHGVTLRSTSRGFGAGNDPNVDPDTARAGVMGEVRALQPNHETRLEAIERAERARAKDLATRKDGAFTKELSKFVGESKLRKTGGVDEIERVRLIQDDRNLKTTWDVEQEEKARRKKERLEKKKREAAERAAQAEAEAGMQNEDDLAGSPEVGGDGNQHGLHQDGPNSNFDINFDQPLQQDSGDGHNRASGEHSDPQRKSWLPSIFSG